MNFIAKVGEQVGDFSRSLFSPLWSNNGLRTFGRYFTFSFWSERRQTRSVVNYDLTRRIYRNDGDNCLGTGFAKPIVDLQVGFIGIPIANTENEETNDFLNECITDHWANEIQEMMRDVLRDSKTIVRIRRPDILDPLMTLDEAEHCALEIVPPELVEIERNTRNKNVIERAVIRHTMVFSRTREIPLPARIRQWRSMMCWRSSPARISVLRQERQRVAGQPRYDQPLRASCRSWRFTTSGTPRSGSGRATSRRRCPSWRHFTMS